MAIISKITLPNGSTYDLRDADAQQKIDALLQGGLVLEKVDTLPTASADTLGKIYLVADTHSDNNDIYDEWITIVGGTATNPTYSWEKIGNTDVDLSGYAQYGDGVTVSGTLVTGVSSHSITDNGHTHTVTITPSTDKVLGIDSKFSTSESTVTLGTFGSSNFATSVKSFTQPTISLATVSDAVANQTVSVLTSATAEASGGSIAWNSKDQKTAITSYPGVKKKLTTDKIYGVGATTTTASKATKSADVAAYTGVTAKTTGTDTPTASSLVTANWTVSNETLNISWGAPSTTSIANYTMANVDVPVKNTNQTTVATGSLSETNVTTNVGSEIMTGLGTAQTANVIGASSTFTVTQPTITVSPTSANLKATATNGAVTLNTSKALTSAPTTGNTAAAQEITLTTADEVTAWTGYSAASATNSKTGITIADHTVTTGTKTLTGKIDEK